MPEFNTAADIGNRALQHVGAQMMDPNLGFADGSNNANQVSFCYGKLRQAELQRNTWTFSTRRAALRALDINTAILQPTLWDPVVTYFLGSIVQDQSGTLWKSIVRDNLGNDPQNTLDSWVPYFGPMSVSLYDFQVAYYVGELTYTAAGDGTYQVYESQVSGNGLDPSLPNVWSNLTTYAKDNVVTVYPAFSSVTTYAAGATVVDGGGNIFTSLTNGNIGNTPATSPTRWVLTPILQLVPQQNTITQAGTVVQLPFTPPPGLSQPLGNLPQTSPVIEWQASLTYPIASFVMFNAVEYVSIQNNNIGNQPNTSPAFWAPLTGGVAYQSLIDFNNNNNPANAPPLWLPGTTYSVGQKVGASNGLIYMSVVGSNIGNDPSADSGAHWTNTHVLNPWSTAIGGGSMNQQWILIGGTAFANGVGISPLLVTYPVGAGPLSQSWSKNVYLLPAGHLRKAPQDPKAGINSWLGAPGNLQALDWTFEGDFLVTWDSQPIIYRFVADTQNFFRDPKTVMFCEALAARIALEVCEAITQSTAKLQVIGQEYKKFMGEAITQNAIEVGPVTPPLDDFIATRI